MRRLKAKRRVLGMAWVCALSACSSQSAVVTLAGTVKDSATGAAITNAVTLVQSGELSANLAPGTNPNAYLFGAEVDSQGAFTLTVPQNSYTLRVYAPGYHFSAAASGGAALQFELDANSGDELPPVLSEATFVPTRQVPTELVSFTVKVQMQDSNDTLESPLFLVNPSTFWARSLQVSPDNALNDANTTWTGSYSAPASGGAFNYLAIASTASGLAAVTQAQLTVAR